MKIETHLEKIEHLEASLNKLDDESDYEAIIEIIMLLSAHHINAAMHEMNTLRFDKDIKHNRLYGTLIREKRLGDKSNTMANAIVKIDQLRPKHVYGSGKNGKTAKSAKKQYDIIKSTCRGIMHV